MQQRPLPYRWVVLGARVATMAVWVPMGVSLGILLPDITASLGLSPVEQGWLGGAVNLGNALLGVPAAWLFSRWDARAVLALAAAAISLLCVVQALSPTFAVLLAARALAGVAVVSLSPARTAITQQWFPLREVALVNGVEIATIGVLEWLTLSGTSYLVDLLGGWRPVMFAQGALGLASAAAWAVLGSRRPPHPVQRSEFHVQGSPVAVLVRRRELWIVALALCGAPAFWWTFVTFWPTYMESRFGMGLDTSGVLFGLTSLGMAPGSLLLGWLCSRRTALRRPVLWGCGLALAATAWAMLLTDSFPLLLTLCTVQGLAWGFIPVAMTVPFELPHLSAREVSVAVAFVWTVGSAGGLVAPVVAGALMAAWQDMGAALAAIAVLGLSVCATGFALPRSAVGAADPGAAVDERTPPRPA